MVRPQLRNQKLRVLRHVHHGHGKTDFVVVVPFALIELEIARQNACDHFLRRRLADASGDADHLHARHFTIVLCNFSVGAQWAFDHHARKLLARAADQRG